MHKSNLRKGERRNRSRRMQNGGIWKKGGNYENYYENGFKWKTE